MYLAGAIVDPEGPHLPVEDGKGNILAHAQGAGDLKRPVHRPVHRLGDKDLGHGGLVADPLPPVQLPGGVPDHEAGGVELHVAVGDHELNALVLGELFAEGLPLQGVLLGELRGPHPHPEPAHAVGQPGRIQAEFGVLEPLPHLAQDRLLPHLAPLEDQLPVPP